MNGNISHLTSRMLETLVWDTFQRNRSKCTIFMFTHYSLSNIESSFILYGNTVLRFSGSFSRYTWRNHLIRYSLWLCRNVGSLSTTRHVISIGIRSILDSVDVVPGLGKVYDDVSIKESITDTTRETNVGETPEEGPGTIDD